MMSFFDLCGKALGNSDYIGLAKNIHTLILTDVPQLSLDRRDYLRRFIWLIDNLYNHKTVLYVVMEGSSEVTTVMKNIYFSGEDNASV
jgi:cell division protein ZapE